jgi:hypothetical protein
MLSAYSKNNERSERVGREHIESGQYFLRRGFSGES